MSYEVGVEKPDPKIFEEAMGISKLKGLKPEECLHVGDRVLLDYVGARSCNWQAALIDDRTPDVIKQKYPQLDLKHLFSSLYHLHKHFVEQDDRKLSTHSL